VGLVDADSVGITVVDEATVQFDLGDAAGQFSNLAALWLTAPAPPTSQLAAPAVAGGSGGPTGNGPFRVDSWDGDRRLRLVGNDYYWAGPVATAVDLVFGREAVERTLDAHATVPPVPAAAEDRPADVVALPDEMAAAALGDPRLAPLLQRQPRPASYWLACNVARKPLDNVLLRKALAYAIDRDAYVTQVLDGLGRPAYSLLPRGVLGHDPAAGAGYRLRPEVAQALLAATRLDQEDLAGLAVTIPATTQGRRAGAFLRDQLERNLQVRLDIVEVDRYSYPRALEQRQYALAFGGWESVYPDPEAWFWLVFGAGKAENRTGWENPALDRLWREADERVDLDRRLDLYSAAQQILLDEMPVIFLAQPERVAIVRPRVQGFSVDVMDAFPGAGSLARLRLLA
jgi:ABC-type oligopeptide transport system substrate-binding subunit